VYWSAGEASLYKAAVAFSSRSLAPQQSTLLYRLKTLRVSGLEIFLQLSSSVCMSCTPFDARELRLSGDAHAYE
jgi:hypothetical protein